MEHLSPELRQKVFKMSETRLRQKLVQAGYRAVDVAKVARATLLEYYAKVLLTETAYVPAKKEQEEGEEAASDGEEEAEFAESDTGVQNTAGGESDAGVQHTAGGDQSAEERRIAREERQLALEERKLEQQRMQLEQQRMQLEEQRLQREQQRELEEKRLEMQRMQLEQQHEEQRRQRDFEERKWREDRAYKESTAVQIKTWGDALRNTITKMPSEGIDVVSWFVSIDKLFEQLNVPADLQAILIDHIYRTVQSF